MNFSKITYRIVIFSLSISGFSCSVESNDQIEVYQTSANGDKLTRIGMTDEDVDFKIVLDTSEKYQEIIGFGGAFTESSAWLLSNISDENRDKVIQSYFGESGLNYSLTRTHINSCDFSLKSYSYARVPDDYNLENFSIDEDRDDLIPMIMEAMAVSREGFRIIASPWTAPPWMKTNNQWFGGKLKKENYPVWAKYFVRYLQAYENEGINIWGITVENEPLGNGAQWESMEFTPREMAEFTTDFLVPALEQNNLHPKILLYDQNRGEELENWAGELLSNDSLRKVIYGTAVHWYSNTVDWLPESLEYTYNLAPDKAIIHTEGCIDAEVPVWNNDLWYWSKNATDWGYDWAPEDQKEDHPKYVPVFRYARDIIGCMNSNVKGWVDWNMVLDRQGGPNHAENWCIAPVIVDPPTDSVYYTPLFYTMGHFSKFIRPGARRIGCEVGTDKLMACAMINPNGSIAVVVLNQEEEPQNFGLLLNGKEYQIEIDGPALQTILIDVEKAYNQ